MKAVSGITMMLLFISMFNVAFQVKPAMTESVGSYISVPHHYQTKSYYCGPASLEMVFDFYSPDIPQLEIADVARTSYVYAGTFTDDMRRAAHFSNLSTSVGVEMPGSVTGYSARKLGYASFEHWGFSLEELKSLIDAGYPIIVLTWFTKAKIYGHYRVVVGYNETHVTLHDPWFGPMRNMTTSEFLDFWEYSYYWGLFVSPWSISISAPENVRERDTFTVTATMTYPCPIPFPTFNYPASSTNATTILPVGISLVPGETTKKVVDTGSMVAGNVATVSWLVKADSLGAYTIEVEVEGKITGSVSQHGPYPSYSYEDRIGGFANSSIEVTSAITPPGMSADLVRRAAWPEHHHFVLSRDGDHSIDDRHGTPGNQTLYGMVKNTGNVTILAGTYKVTWNISDSTGFLRIVETVGSTDLTLGEITVLTYDVSATDLVPSKYYVEARCCYYYVLEGEKTFSFTVVP